VVADPDGQVAEIYRSIARRIAVKVDELSQDYSELFAKIVIEDN
jgi:ATP-binding protein involved in chromosome partitioning